MKVVHLVESVSRNGAGLSESVRRLSLGLAQNKKIDISVIAFRDKFTEVDLIDWLPLRPKILSPLHLGFGFIYAVGLKDAVIEENPDLVHNNGLWLHPSIACTKWKQKAGKPYVISPQGMLDLWAIQYSAWKKRIACLLYENEHLRNAACLQALSEAETRSMRDFGLKNPICIIPNGTDIPDIHGEKDKVNQEVNKNKSGSQAPPWDGSVEKGRKVLLYLGRIHPKKGLPNLISALHRLQGRESHNFFSDWVLAIAGWDQNRHEAILRHQAEELCLNGQVIFLGPQFKEAKTSAYRHADAFILPSFSEGMPMAVLEAWAYGLPILMTSACNLPEGFKSEAAIRIDPQVESIGQGLEVLASMTDRERKAMGMRGRRLVETNFSLPKITADMKAVYEWVLGGGNRPNCVTTE